MSRRFAPGAPDLESRTLLNATQIISGPPVIAPHHHGMDANEHAKHTEAVAQAIQATSTFVATDSAAGTGSSATTGSGDPEPEPDPVPVPDPNDPPAPPPPNDGNPPSVPLPPIPIGPVGPGESSSGSASGSATAQVAADVARTTNNGGSIYVGNGVATLTPDA